MIPRKLHCPECGTFIGRAWWPETPVRVVGHDREAAAASDVRVCSRCGPVECEIAPGVVRWLLLALRRVAA